MKLVHVNIEPTNKCQLNCSYCGDDKTRQIGYITIENYNKILDQIPHPLEIRLFLSGEPFLHRDIIKLIDLALRRGHVVLIHSNGLLITEDIAKQLLKYDTPMLNISFSMHAKKVTEGMKYLIENYKMTGIILQTIVPYPQPLAVPEYLVEYLDKVRIHVRHPHNWDEVSSVENSQKEEFTPPCGFLEDSVAIYWNGDVPVCCADLNGRRIIGNIFKDGLPNIIKKLDNFCELQREGKPCPICKGCERYEPLVTPRPKERGIPAR